MTQILRALGAIGFELGHGVGLLVEDDAFVACPHQTPGYVATHPAETDYAKLHDVTPCLHCRESEPGTVRQPPHGFAWIVRLPRNVPSVWQDHWLRRVVRL
jgi:hypothetical protein